MRHEHQILNRIVSWIAVNVMDNLASREFSAISLLPDPPMLIGPAPRVINLDGHVTIVSNPPCSNGGGLRMNRTLPGVLSSRAIRKLALHGLGPLRDNCRILGDSLLETRFRCVAWHSALHMP